jgi:hypothetical protein
MVIGFALASIDDNVHWETLIYKPMQQTQLMPDKGDDMERPGGGFSRETISAQDFRAKNLAPYVILR